MVATPQSGVPWTGPGVDDLTQQIIDNNEAAAEEEAGEGGNGAQSLLVVASSTDELDLDAAAYDIFDITVDDDCTITLASAVTVRTVQLRLTSDGTDHTVTLPDGEALTLLSEAVAYAVVAQTLNSGASWAYWAPGLPHVTNPGRAAQVYGPFDIAFDDVGLEDGIVLFTPEVGDVLVDAWVQIDEAWDGTTPLGDLGFVDSGNFGIYGFIFGSINMSMGANLESGGGYLGGLAGQSLSTLSVLAGGGVRAVPTLITAANPVRFWVSQDGAVGGASPGATQGSAKVYLLVAAVA